jgi:hypothetical protein
MAMNSVMGALMESWKSFQFKFDVTAEPFKADKLNTSETREITVQEFLEMCFPLPYRVVKGCIYDINGSSNNIDCVLLAPNHPKLTTPTGRNVILAEGVHSAIEVKPDIQNSAEFRRGLEQIKSVKDLKRHMTEFSFGEPTPPEFKQIPCVLFANKSKNDWKDTVKQMHNFANEYGVDGSVLPDVIVSLDKGLVFHTTHIEKTMFSSWASVVVNGHVLGGDQFIFLECTGENLLGALLLIMLSFVPPELPFDEPIIKRYLLSPSGLPNVKYFVFPGIKPQLKSRQT